MRYEFRPQVKTYLTKTQHTLTTIGFNKIYLCAKNTLVELANQKPYQKVYNINYIMEI